MSGITIALSKGRIFEETLPLLAAAGIVPAEDPEKSRKLIIGTNRDDVRVVIVRASDVPTYVQYGAADLGIAGKDVLLEHGGIGLYQPLDLDIAKCRMCVAAPVGFDYAAAVRRGARLRIATKYIAVAREHFAAKGVHVDLIKLYGSMELAPLAGRGRGDCRPGVQRRHAEGQQAGRSRGDHEDFFAPRGEPGGAQGQAGIAAACDCCHRGRNPMIRRLTSADSDFAATLDALLHFDHSTDDAIEQTVAEILRRVRAEGDAAVLDYTRRFDQLDVGTMAELELPRSQLQQALDRLPPAQRSALEAAAQRVTSYHERQKLESWSFTEADGTRLGQKITALDRVGLYVPGGKAAYPSSVLMNALPAKVAGVGELIMVVPTPRGEKNALVLAAACLSGVDRVFTLGGAQAVAALAYGTQTIPQVDKIRRSRQCLRRGCKKARVRHRRYRHGGRAVGSADHRRCLGQSGLGRDRPVRPGRAR